MAGATEETDPPTVNSVTFTVNGSPVTVTGVDNEFTVNLTGNDTDMFTAITVRASEDAEKAEISLMGISKQLTFQQGTASTTVSQLLGDLDNGGDGVKPEKTKKYS